MFTFFLGCDTDSGKNPLNWKYGGTARANSVTYKISPKKDQGFYPGICSFHLQENEKWSGADSPGFSRSWGFFIQDFTLQDGLPREIARLGLKDDNQDPFPAGIVNDKNDPGPLIIDAKLDGGSVATLKNYPLPDPIVITPEAQGDYIQFVYGSQSWRSSQSAGNQRCNVGKFNTEFDWPNAKGVSKAVSTPLPFLAPSTLHSCGLWT